ncbi:MAG TPA: ABC transporter substrate-binding protein [Candidatus Acidoferrales bacterium]|nr:ABC transporter substrate-binding protein [Candidatus Acidoferrales bacterium]
MKKILTLTTVLIILSSLVAGYIVNKDMFAGKSPEKPTLKVGYLPITHSLGVVVADKLYQGKYKNFNLELVRFSSWPELSEALNSGHIQGASILLPLAIGSMEKGVNLQVMALSHRDGNAMVVANDINTIKDLKGKRVAIPDRMSVHYILLFQALKDSGMTLDDVQWIEMPPPDMPAALANGDIKGYIVAENFGAQAVVGGYGKLLFKGQDVLPDECCCGYVLNKDFKEKYPDATQEFIDSIVHAGQFIDNNRTGAIGIGKQYMKMDDKVWEKSFEWGIKFSDLKPTREDLDTLQKYMVELKLIKAPLSMDKLLDDSFVSRAYQKGGGGTNEAS